jgi:hypothetical protein
MECFRLILPQRSRVPRFHTFNVRSRAITSLAGRSYIQSIRIKGICHALYTLLELIGFNGVVDCEVCAMPISSPFSCHGSVERQKGTEMHQFNKTCRGHGKRDATLYGNHETVRWMKRNARIRCCALRGWRISELVVEGNLLEIYRCILPYTVEIKTMQFSITTRGCTTQPLWSEHEYTLPRFYREHSQCFGDWACLGGDHQRSDTPKITHRS